VFDQVEFRGNTAGTDGGGMYSFATMSVSSGAEVYTTSPVLTNVMFEENSAENGGAVYNQSHYLVMTGAVFRKNFASGPGGGIYNSGGAILTNIRLEENTTFTFGGAIYNWLRPEGNQTGHLRNVLIITNGVIRNNRAGTDADGGSGAGIFCHYTITVVPLITPEKLIMQLALTNVLIAGNMADNGGGGIFVYNTTAGTIATADAGKGVNILMNNVTITDNQADIGATKYWNGGGIWINQATTPEANFTRIAANNSVIWGNTAYSAARSNISNSTSTSRLTLNNSWAPAPAGQYIDGGDNTALTASPFSGTSYYPATSNTGSSTLYSAITADTLLTGPKANDQTNTGASDPVLDGDRYTGFKNRLQSAIFGGGSNAAITKDAPPAGTGTASHGNRTNGTIDVGAYENQ
jgi:hypothetical protein